MTRVAVVEIEGCLASSAAITHDVMATANQISGTAKRALPFNVTTVRCGPRRNGADLPPRRTRHRPRPRYGFCGRTRRETEKHGLPARRRHACRSVRIRRRACRVLREHIPARGSRAAGRPAGNHDLVAGAAVSAALSQGRAGDRPDGRGGLADRNGWRSDGADGSDARRRGPVCRTRPCQGLRQLSAAGGASLPGCPSWRSPIWRARTRRSPRAEKWVRDNIGRDFAIEELAEAVALAPRTFARRIAATCGVSPIQFVQRIRIETARYLLETTRLSVEEIARQVGYAEPSTLRRLIRRDTKHSPGHFRPAA